MPAPPMPPVDELLEALDEVVLLDELDAPPVPVPPLEQAARSPEVNAKAQRRKDAKTERSMEECRAYWGLKW